jgi:Ca-activated chloride channel family protein
MKIKTAFVAPPPPRPEAAPAATEPASPGPSVEATAGVNGPAAADMAARIEVPWTGPGAKDDFISVARPAQPSGSFVNRAFVREGNPAKVWAPSDPGEYEVRYILGRGMKLLAKAPLTVNAVAASVQPPASTTAGMEFEVAWQGPGYAGDFISVARSGQPPGASVSSTKVRPGSTLKLRAPREPGTYEVRYILGRGTKLLAKAVLAVKAP